MKLLDRRRSDGDPAEALPGTLERLAAAREALTAAERRVEQAKAARVESEELVADEFHGNVAPDEAQRRRAEIEREVVEAERDAEHAARVVKVGEDECLKLVGAIHAQREAARQQTVRQAQQDLADAQTAVVGAEARLQRLDAQKLDRERQHADARGLIRARHKRNWAAEDHALVRRFVEGTVREQAGVDPLPARLQSTADEYLADLKAQGVSDEYLDEVARRGNYVRLARDGSPRRLPDEFQPNR